MAKIGDYFLRPCSLFRKSVGFTVGVPIVCVLLSLSVFLFWHRHFLVSPTTEDDLEDVGNEPFTVSSHNIIFEIHGGAQITLKLKKPVKNDATVKIMLDDPAIIETIQAFPLTRNQLDQPIYIPINSRDVAGHCVMSFQSESKELGGLYKIRIKIKVVHHILFGYLSIALGWCYLFSWCITYYPQIYRNYSRRSVVGFSFDYLALNMTGHLCYCTFNTAMYYNNFIQKSYTDIHPKGELPVKIHDVLFSVHAVTMNFIYLTQTFFFERGDQRVSMTMGVFVGGLWITIAAGLFGCITERFSWLPYLYYLTYIKLGTTPIKYTPQLYLHCIRKSTEGWSIISVFLDLTGSLLVLLQMFIDAANNDDWDGTIGNPGKLGIGAMGVIYGSSFALQHFCLYPPSKSRKRLVSDSVEFNQQLEKLKASFSPPVKKLGGIQNI